jgi:uncharacterized protein (DUF2237 family)
MMKKSYILFIFSIFFWEQTALAHQESKNVLGGALEQHSAELSTGFYRDGYCRTGPEDAGTHVVAAIVTEEFLAFTKTRGNDLQTPRAEFHFPGLKAGDRWCLCAARWREAEHAGLAPMVDLKATDKKALDYIPLKTLMKYQEK